MSKMENTGDSTTTKEGTSDIEPKTLSSNISKEIGDKTRLVGAKLSPKLCSELLAHLRKVGNVNI